MKKLLCLLCCLLSLNTFSQNLSTQVSLFPTDPQAGQKIKITYHPKQFIGSTKLSCYIYQNSDQTRVKVLPLQNNNNWYEAEFIPDNDVKSFLLVFRDSDGVVDNNNGEGYWSPVYDNGKPVEGALSSIADMYASWENLVYALDKRNDIALDLYNKEFTQNVHLKRRHLLPYLLAVQGTNSFSKNQFKRELQGFTLYDDLTEVELRFLAKFFAEINEVAKAKELNKLRHQKYPKDRNVIEEENKDFHFEFAIEKSFSKKKEMFYAFCARYADLEDSIVIRLNQFRRGTMLAKLAVYYLKENKLEEWEREVAKLSAAGQCTSFYLGANDLNNKDVYLDKAELFAQRASELELKLLEVPRHWNEPLYFTDEQIQNFRYKNAAWKFKNYGMILMKNNKLKMADSVLKEASITYGKGEHSEINEIYIECLIKQGKIELAEEEAIRFIKTQKSSPHIDAFLKQIDKAENKISTINIDKTKNRVPVNLISESLSNFYFVDTTGKQVTKQSLIGKVVIVDCWATWCNSCIAGFPGMYNLTKKYRDNKDVIFLFLNTSEFGGNVEEKARNLIKSLGYDFNIVFDHENVAVDKLKVNGLPAKFVIDQAGNIRFRQVGETDGFIEKLDAVIEQLMN